MLREQGAFFGASYERGWGVAHRELCWRRQARLRGRHVKQRTINGNRIGLAFDADGRERFKIQSPLRELARRRIT